MPRSLQEIIEQADTLANKFEDLEPSGERVDAERLGLIRHAAIERAEAERHVVEAVALARKDGLSWASIGAALGTSGEAARQRYGQQVAPWTAAPA